jgi:DNA-binding NtrC family response regulator
MPDSRAAIHPFEVLVVDDEPDVRELLVEFLRDHGFSPASAADGRAALAAIAREPARYQLILTDLQLPGADGLAVLKAARAANPSVYVVIITGYASLDSAIQAVRLGAYDYLTKPFSIGQIEVIVQRVADHLALEAENRQLTRLVRRDATRRTTPADGALSLGVRLEAIEGRLARCEVLLREVLERLDRGGTTSRR